MPGTQVCHRGWRCAGLAAPSSQTQSQPSTAGKAAGQPEYPTSNSYSLQHSTAHLGSSHIAGGVAAALLPMQWRCLTPNSNGEHGRSTQSLLPGKQLAASSAARHKPPECRTAPEPHLDISVIANQQVLRLEVPASQHSTNHGNNVTYKPGTQLC